MTRDAAPAPAAPPAPEVGSRLAAALRQVVRETCGLVVPLECACGEEGALLCAGCRALLGRSPQRVDEALDALQILQSARIRESAEGPAGADHRALLPVIALGDYSGPLQRLVLGWKNGGRAHLVGPFADALAPALGTARTPLLLVPVPSRLSARIRRGADHTRELAEALQRRAAAPARVMPVTVRMGEGQRGRGARQRRARSLELSRVTARRLRSAASGGARILLIDDVVTTGSTLRALHAALAREGVAASGALVVASARMPGGAP